MSNQVWIPAYVGVGSNLANPIAQVQRGFTALATLPSTQLVVTSSLYITAPIGPKDQPDFVNAVAALLTQLDALSLLRALKALEQAQGRDQPVERWGPRLIDFDLLLLGDQCMQTEELTLPHPGMHERSFVLIPFAEIAPDVFVPGKGRIAALLSSIDQTDARRIAAA